MFHRNHASSTCILLISLIEWQYLRRWHASFGFFCKTIHAKVRNAYVHWLMLMGVFVFSFANPYCYWKRIFRLVRTQRSKIDILIWPNLVGFFLADIVASKGMLFWIVIDVIACADLPRIKIVSKIELPLSEVPRISNAFEGANDNGGSAALTLVRTCGWGAFEESALDEEIGPLWTIGMMLGSSARADFPCRIGFTHFFLFPHNIFCQFLIVYWGGCFNGGWWVGHASLDFHCCAVTWGCFLLLWYWWWCRGALCFEQVCLVASFTKTKADNILTCK